MLQELIVRHNLPKTAINESKETDLTQIALILKSDPLATVVLSLILCCVVTGFAVYHFCKRFDETGLRCFVDYAVWLTISLYLMYTGFLWWLLA